MGRKIDLKGQQFGRLKVITEAGRGKTRNVLWRCECDCGNVVIVAAGNLRNGHTKSCDCLQREVAAAGLAIRATTHGLSRSNPSEYMCWFDMMKRCYDLENKGYYLYGFRGITVCERWHEFKNFLEDMGRRPSGMSIDRINNNGNYEPGNCKWSTRTEQNRNRRAFMKHRRRLAEPFIFASLTRYRDTI